MAKKPAAKKTAPQKSAKKSGKKSPAKKVERIEIELSPAEEKALKLAYSSNDVRGDLETTVTAAIAQAVRKVFKQHGVALTAVQAQEVAMILFGD